ncbi:four-carbon acid sugar kinase family protein [Ammoniphilus resinae]|uniref:Uncharacterized protein YgbK (DUF1537 family) n=1 Tax=Ammoniphilus resinae TaxID=861532 RepID=A0ABS4GWB9_9BACL|nr:four-carbon acid sugar kinase family protein [Ammoniphilus resinae]MBP1934568.1 uncharacterized protein YgbK (DUF1537 family) [Ammoniphilus resinae]
MTKIAIIADDLTGALDSAVYFGKEGYPTVCYLEWGEKTISTLSPSEVTVFNTNSRNLPEEQLESCLKPYIDWSSSAKIWFKKIDSTLRGHIGRELEIFIQQLKPDAVLVSPAYLDTGRTVNQGSLFVYGVPLEKTELAYDLPDDCRTSQLVKRFSYKSNIKMKHMNRTEYWNKQSIMDTIETALLQGINVFSFDMIHQEDEALLIEIGTKLQTTGKKILWCGSAGLAKALAHSLPSKLKSSLSLLINHSRLWIIGSRKMISHQQANELIQKTSAAVLLISGNSLTTEQQLKIKLAVEEKKDIVLYSAIEETSSECKPEIAQHLAQAARNILELYRTKINYIILVGGDTGSIFLQTIGGNTIHIIGEIEDAVPCSRVITNDHHEFILITKGGSIGDVGTLSRVWNWINKGRE